jgi:hypothetical protein
MGDRAWSKSRGATLTVKDMMVWVAALAALGGLAEEVVRHAKLSESTGVVGVFLVVYVIYLAFSVRLFWNAPRISVPTTMLISGVLYTLVLQILAKVPLLVAVGLVIAVPCATALGLRLIFPKMVEPDDDTEDATRPLTVQSLLMRHRGLGARAVPVKASAEPEL